MPTDPGLPEGVSHHEMREPLFLGPQLGTAADLLHAEFRTALSALPQIERAYFCKIRYPGEEINRAALCLVSAAPQDMTAVTALSAVIREHFDRDCDIDLLFLSPDMEQRVKAVCSPFHNRAETPLAPTVVNGLFRCPLKVRPGPGCKKPAKWVGAYVDCFAASGDHLSALQLAVNRLGEVGWLFEDLVNGRVEQLDPHRWDEYVASAPKEWAGSLPSQEMVVRLVQAGAVFFGPFCGWESGAEPD
jgi:hypothetical protein